MRYRLRTLISSILLFTIMTTLSATAIVAALGYRDYRMVLADVSVDDTVSAIKNKSDFQPLDQLPPMYLNAVIAAEDHRFYRHPGFDLLATMRALKNDLIAGAFIEGGSTIPQQLAKNLFFTQEKRILRKVSEVYMAFYLERHYSKDELLALYVNSIYFGAGYTGISAASHGYYHCSPKELTHYQMVMLAGIPNAPSVYALTENPDLAVKRQEQVLQKMIDYRYINKKEAAVILSQGG